MAPELEICQNNARFLWYCCSIRLWKQGQQRPRKNYHAWACRASACLNTPQVSTFGSWHYSPVLFEVFLPLATASDPGLSCTLREPWAPLLRPLSILRSERGSVLFSKTLHKLKQTHSEKISTKEVITFLYLSEPSADTHVPCRSSSFPYILSRIANERTQTRSNQMN